VLASKSRNGLSKQSPEAHPNDCRSIAGLIFMAQLRTQIRYVLQRFAEDAIRGAAALRGSAQA
jgi:hypothetical protein